MANTGEQGADLRGHQETFNGFTRLMKWGTLVVFLIAALVVLRIAS